MKWDLCHSYINNSEIFLYESLMIESFCDGTFKALA